MSHVFKLKICLLDEDSVVDGILEVKSPLVVKVELYSSYLREEIEKSYFLSIVSVEKTIICSMLLENLRLSDP